MKKIINSVIFLVALTNASYAVKESKIEGVMHQKIHAISNLLKDKSTPLEKKRGKIFSLVDDVFAYQTMAKISLGKKWKSLTSEQKTKFVKKFEQKLKRSYFDKLKFYSNQKVVLKGKKKVKNNRIKLYSQIIGKDDIYDVVYKFYKDKKSDDWKIYDVDIAHVSLVQTYRKQFTDFLKHKSVDELIKSI